MSITAKELAKMLGLSEAAISMALNNKPGVSTKTRKRVIDAAKANGYDFSRIAAEHAETVTESGTIYFVVYRKNGAVVPNLSPAQTEQSAEIPFFAQLSEGINAACKKYRYYLNISYVYEDDDIAAQLALWKQIGAKGLIVLGTEMEEPDLRPFLESQLPMVLLDNYFEHINLDSVMVNNVQGAYTATQYLIRKRHTQPGYLHSSYSITGFEERGDGFYKALRRNGMSTSQSVVHRLTPSIEGAYLDMKELLAAGEKTARCYFADNDFIAAGAMRAFLEAGYRIPQDIALIGFDDMPVCTYISPSLTTVHVPKQYMGELAVRRLSEIMENPSSYPVKIELSTELCKRKSC